MGAFKSAKVRNYNCLTDGSSKEMLFLSKVKSELETSKNKIAALEENINRSKKLLGKVGNMKAEMEVCLLLNIPSNVH
jgi:hypothetical protein